MNAPDTPAAPTATAQAPVLRRLPPETIAVWRARLPARRAARTAFAAQRDRWWPGAFDTTYVRGMAWLDAEQDDPGRPSA